MGQGFTTGLIEVPRDMSHESPLETLKHRTSSILVSDSKAQPRLCAQEAVRRP
jgi:hypothetical protein